MMSVIKVAIDSYNVDYFLTTDTKLKYYVPEKSKLRVIDHEAARGIF